MKNIQAVLIKQQCIEFAANAGLTIEVLTNDHFKALSDDTMIDVPLSHLYQQVQQGWSVQDTLQNESCYLGEY